ncbi:putative rubber elongation factor [Medicago truncatula]|uniref:Putative rubber elongation factor n=1 Tax=Medicago truncatula TaxID=3880 RepID=A0A396IX89_MEDTR|nr:putative rubber elongation factor [Medicago truncatula]
MATIEVVSIVIFLTFLNLVEYTNKELKHLGFLKIAAIHTYVFISYLYESAKKNAGPLRSVVETVEGAVTTVVGPVYNKFKDVPDDVLVFVDNKVDEATDKFSEHATHIAKQLTDKTKFLIQKVTHEAGKVGRPRAAVDYVATETKNLLLINSVKLWTGLNKFPPFHAAAEMTIPTAAHWSKKYNHAIKDMAGKGYSFVGYLALIPIDDISKAFKKGEVKDKKSK